MNMHTAPPQDFDAGFFSKTMHTVWNESLWLDNESPDFVESITPIDHSVSYKVSVGDVLPEPGQYKTLCSLVPVIILSLSQLYIKSSKGNIEGK